VSCDARQGTNDIGFRGDAPILVASLSKTFDDISLVTHQTEQTHDLFPARPDSVLEVGMKEMENNEEDQTRKISSGRRRIFPLISPLAPTYLLNISLCSASFRIKTNSSIPSTSYSMLWINGPKASVISSIKA
jgi:hypothetical protein